MRNFLLVLLLAFSASADAQLSKYRDVPLGEATITANGAQVGVSSLGDQINFSSAGGRFVVNITAVSGTSPTVVFELQGTANGANWFTVCSVGAATSVQSRTCEANNLPATVRVSYGSVGGTSPSFTFNAWLIRQ